MSNVCALTIRNATPDDVEIIAKFNNCLAVETEGKQLDMAMLHRGVANAFDQGEACRYFLAETDVPENGGPSSRRIVGQAMITQEWSDWRDGTFWWFQSVYVEESYRRQGVFEQLYRHIEALAKGTLGVCGLRLYVEQENGRAMATYRSMGMADTGYRVFETEW